MLQVQVDLVKANQVQINITYITRTHLNQLLGLPDFQTNVLDMSKNFRVEGLTDIDQVKSLQTDQQLLADWGRPLLDRMIEFDQLR